MTELNQERTVPAAARSLTAGGLLKQARQAKGLHIAALAASIKVAQRKLELLEADRYAELPDATFTRALAQTVCRSLKIDAAPVLALLPAASGGRLDHMGAGINAPFRDRPGRGEPTDWLRLAASPAAWGPALVLLAAALVYFLPSSVFSGLQFRPAPTASATPVVPVVPAMTAPTTLPVAAATAVAESASGSLPAPVVASAASSPSGAVETVFSAPALTEATPFAAVTAVMGSAATGFAATAAAAITSGGLLASTDAAAPGGILQLRASSESWVEVQDAKRQMLLSRMLMAGETVKLDGELPLRLKVGNASGTEVRFRGQAVNLASGTVGNIARLELK